MVTVETAMVVPVLILVAFMLAGAVGIAGAQVRLVDSSREAARMLARGDDEDRALRAAARLAPGDTRFTVRREDGLVRVTARTTARLAVPVLDRLWGVELRTEAVVVAEGP